MEQKTKYNFFLPDSKLLSRNELVKDDVVQTAANLIGKIIYSFQDNFAVAGRIIETEAYKAPEDKASHAYGNRRTAFTETMFGEPGTAYVYLCYGIHHLLNVVCGPEGTAHAVLIRALQPVYGIEQMEIRRNTKKGKLLCSGPGKLSQALRVTTKLNGTDLLSPQSPLQLLDDGWKPNTGSILATPRIGIEYAAEYRLKPWRFVLETNPPL